jgi:16S rRNA processing protein RimM
LENLITIGEITKYQGNKGEVRVFPLTDFLDRFEYLESVYLVKDKKLVEKTIEEIRYQKKFVIIKFAGIDNIGDAIELKDYLIKIPEEEMVPLYDDEYYIYQIRDYSVRTKDGKQLGHLSDVMRTGGTDVFVVAGDDQEYMIPATREMILEINDENQEILIDPLPGLLEL